MTTNSKEKLVRSTIAQRVKDTRKAKGMSQHDLAAAMIDAGITSVSQSTVSQYEAANIKIDLYTLMLIADALGCSLDHIIGSDTAAGGKVGRLLKIFSAMGEREQETFLRMIEFTQGLGEGAGESEAL